MSKSARPRPPRWQLSPFLGVPEEVVVEILVRLPATCLIHLKRVCRSWRTLISSPEFARYQLERSIGYSDAQIAYSGHFLRLRRIGFSPLHSVFDNPSSSAKVVCVEALRRYHIVGSCNGLLCVLDTGSRTRVRLWNPCTGFTSESLRTGAFVLTCGFGYDHVNDKYKFFAAVMRSRSRPREIVTKIFTFGVNHGWKRIENSPLIFHPFYFVTVIGLKGEFVKGTLNWVVPRPKDVIVYLDLGSETYGELCLPERNPDDNFSITPVIGVLRNCLSVGFDHKKTHWALWLLNENQCWTKLAMIPYHPIFRFARLRTLYISDDDVLLVIGRNDEKLYLIYLNHGRIVLRMIDSSSHNDVTPWSEGIDTRTLSVYYPSLVGDGVMF